MKKLVLICSLIFTFSSAIFSQIPTDGLVGFWSFSGNADDESENINHGTVNGAVLTEDRFGNANSAYLFDASDDYIEVLPSALLDSTIANDFSISIWSNSSALDNKNRFINISNKSEDINLDLTVQDEKIRFWNWSPSPNNINIQTFTNIPINEWIHTIVTYDSETNIGKMFINGEYVNADTAELTLPDQPYLTIGKHTQSTDWVFDGVLDDIRLYNNTLTDEEVTSLFYEGYCFETIYDTITTEVFDTIPVYEYISVTDTLIIDAVLTGIDPPDNINTLKIYPNPAKDYIFINTGDYTKMAGYQLKIINQTGAIVFETLVEEPLYEVNLSTWTGIGLYYVQVIDSGGVIIDIRKIVLQ